jgi:hypothetical protein
MPVEDARIKAKDRPTDRKLSKALGRSVRAIAEAQTSTLAKLSLRRIPLPHKLGHQRSTSIRPVRRKYISKERWVPHFSRFRSNPPVRWSE